MAAGPPRGRSQLREFVKDVVECSVRLNPKRRPARTKSERKPIAVRPKSVGRCGIAGYTLRPGHRDE